MPRQPRSIPDSLHFNVQRSVVRKKQVLVNFRILRDAYLQEVFQLLSPKTLSRTPAVCCASVCMRATQASGVGRRSLATEAICQCSEQEARDLVVKSRKLPNVTLVNQPQICHWVLLQRVQYLMKLHERSTLPTGDCFNHATAGLSVPWCRGSRLAQAASSQADMQFVRSSNQHLGS